MFNYLQTTFLDFVQRAYKLAADLPLTALAIAIGALGTKICGDSFWAVLFLSYAAVFLDTGTKWVAITKRYYADATGCEITAVRGAQVLRGILLGEAWQSEYLNSRYFGRILEKIFTYTIVIAICHAAGKWLPVLELMGLQFTPATVFPASASIAVFLVELSSINENLKEMGQTGVANILNKVVDEIKNKILPRQGGI